MSISLAFSAGKPCCNKKAGKNKAGKNTAKSDKDWVMEQINDLRNGGWLSAVKMKVANEMWNKYDG